MLENYEEWDMAIPAVPKRSRLYPLKPIGIGTPYVECLSSYFIRLANAHHLQPKRLISQEILPLVRGEDQIPLSADNFLSWLKSSFNVNGTTLFTYRWICALEQLTARSDLRFLTMFTWNDVIHRRDLVRKFKAWCADCYREWLEKDQVIYEPLMWCLNSIVSCPQHQKPFSYLCPNEDCRKSVPLFADWSRSGYCPYCAYFLGSGHVTDEREHLLNDLNTAWINDCVGELVSIAPKLILRPSLGDFALKISLLLQRKGKSYTQTLAEKLGVSASNVVGWQQGLHTMRFDVLLKLCHQLQTRPASLLIDIEDNKENGSWSAFEEYLRNINMQEIEDILRTKLKASLSPISLKNVTEELGYSSGFLQYYFPDLCFAITDKYSSRQKKTQSIERTIAKRELEDILANDEFPPPLMEIARRLNCTISALRRHFPDLCEEILKRRRLSPKKVGTRRDKTLIVKETISYKASEKAIGVKRHYRRLEEWEQQKKMLEEALSGEEFLSLKAIAKSLGCHCKILRKRFPELCHLVEERYNKSFDLDQISQALTKALTCTIKPPSVKEIAKLLGYPDKVLEHHFPELCSEIFKRRLIKFDLSYLRSALETVLTNEEEPISVSEVGRRLGHSADLLRTHFPELCTAISAKYREFRHQRKQERVNKLCLAAQEAAIAIHNQGERPTETRVASIIGGSIHFIIPEVRYAWKQKMEELGYEK